MKYNKRNIPKFEAEIKALIEQEGSDETARVEALVQKYTGPGVGLVYDPETGKLNLAEGWVFDKNGDIVRLDDITGPGVGL